MFARHHRGGGGGPARAGCGIARERICRSARIELEERGLRFQREVGIHGTYKGKDVGLVYRADFIVEDSVVLELKALEGVTDVHKAQLLTYLKMSGHKLGLLINFHAFPVVKGVHRLVNKL